MNDKRIQLDVTDELQWDPNVDATQIGVTVKDGIVTLSGHVTAYAEKFEAERVTRHVHGVRAVANDLEIPALGPHPPSDTEIAALALNALKRHAGLSDEQIQLTVRAGWITLEGMVEGRQRKDAADQAVRNLAGVHGVTNLMVVKPRPSVPDIKHKIEEAFRCSADLDSQAIKVAAHDSTVTLTCRLHSLTEREEAERVARAAPGVSRVHNQIMVTPCDDD